MKLFNVVTRLLQYPSFMCEKTMGLIRLPLARIVAFSSTLLVVALMADHLHGKYLWPAAQAGMNQSAGDETFFVDYRDQQIAVTVNSDAEQVAIQIERWERLQSSVENRVLQAVRGDDVDIAAYVQPFVDRFRPCKLQTELQEILSTDWADFPTQFLAARWLTVYDDPAALQWFFDRLQQEADFSRQMDILVELTARIRDAYRPAVPSTFHLEPEASERVIDTLLSLFEEANSVHRNRLSIKHRWAFTYATRTHFLDAIAAPSTVVALCEYLEKQTSIAYHHRSLLRWLAQRHPSQRVLEIARRFAELRPVDSETEIPEAILIVASQSDEQLTQGALELYCELAEFYVAGRKREIESRKRETTELMQRDDRMMLDVWSHRTRLAGLAIKHGVELPVEFLESLKSELLRRIDENPVIVPSVWSNTLSHDVFDETTAGSISVLAQLFENSDNPQVLAFLQSANLSQLLFASRVVAARSTEELEGKLKSEARTKLGFPHDGQTHWYGWISNSGELTDLLQIFHQHGVAQNITARQVASRLESMATNSKYRLSPFPFTAKRGEFAVHDAILAILDLDQRVKHYHDGLAFGKYDPDFWLLVDLSRGEFAASAFTVTGTEDSRMSFVLDDERYTMPYSVHSDPGINLLMPLFNTILERRGTTTSRFRYKGDYANLYSFNVRLLILYGPDALFEQLDTLFAIHSN